MSETIGAIRRPKSVSSAPSLASPAVAGGVIARNTAPRSFLADVVIEHGPRDVFGRLFLKADTELRERGIRMSFASFDELLAVNEANPETWRPVLPIFNPRNSHLPPETAFALIGRDASGVPVTAQACRCLELGDTTLKEEIESLRLFYADPEAMKGPDESMQVSAPTPGQTSGRVLFSGALWYRRDFRKIGLLSIIQPMLRALAYTRWPAQYVCSFMAPEVLKGGIARNGLFLHVEHEVTMINTPVLRDGIIPAAFIYTTESEQLRQFDDYMAVRTPMQDAFTSERRAAG